MERRTLLEGRRPLPARRTCSSRDSARAAEKNIVYLTPGLDLPFWRYLSQGIETDRQAGRLRLHRARQPQQRRNAA